MTLELDTSSSGDAADSRLKSDQVWACTFSAVHDVPGLLDLTGLDTFSAVTPAFPAFQVDWAYTFSAADATFPAFEKRETQEFLRKWCVPTFRSPLVQLRAATQRLAGI
jgi:hypothetical protein